MACTTSEADLASPPGAAPARAHLFPPEVLLLIVQDSAVVSDTHPNHQHFTDRNADLAQLALVNHDFQEAVYSVLYGQMRISWLAGNASRLTESFERNPQLPLLVRSVDAAGINAEGWAEDRMGDAVDDGGAEWQPLYEATVAAWVAVGHARWEESGDEYGIQDFVDLLLSLSNLKSVEVRGFADTDLPAEFVDRGGSLPITSISARGACPFLQTSELASFLVSKSPHLTRLSGELDLRIEEGSSAAFLPTSLAHLDIRNLLHLGHLEQDLVKILRKVKPQSLELTVHGQGWAPTVAPHLSLLSSLSLHTEWGNYTSQSDIEALLHAFSTSTTLKCLDLDFGVPPVFLSSLPTSLSSLVIESFTQIIGEYVKSALFALRRSKGRPLRFAVRGLRQEQRREGLDLVDEFMKEGIYLSFI